MLMRAIALRRKLNMNCYGRTHRPESAVRLRDRYSCLKFPPGLGYCPSHDRRSEICDGGVSCEDHLRTRSRVGVGRSLVVRSTHSSCADRDNTQFEHSRPSDTRNRWSEPVRGECAFKAGSWRDAAFVAGGHRPRIETESWAAAVECRYPFGQRPALGTIGRSLAARECGALCR